MSNRISSNFNSTLPFTINYSSPTNEQISCQNNMNVLPNGPIFPSRPIFPNSLPPSLTQYPSTVQTNFINVKNQAYICNLRCSSLIVDSGISDTSQIRFNNLPEVPETISSGKLFNLIIDDKGNVYRSKVISNTINKTSNQQLLNLSLFEDPLGDI